MPQYLAYFLKTTLCSIYKVCPGHYMTRASHTASQILVEMPIHFSKLNSTTALASMNGSVVGSALCTLL